MSEIKQVKLQMPDGDKTVSGAIIGELVVHPALNATGVDETRFHISHLSTGLRLPRLEFDSEAKAVTAAKKLRDTLDWAAITRGAKRGEATIPAHDAARETYRKAIEQFL